MRRAGPALALATALLLSGCSPANKWGITRVDGVPAVNNCGAWITSIRAQDADTGRVVWEGAVDEARVDAARAGPTTTTPSNPYGTVQQAAGLVVLGTLPNDVWSELQPLVSNPPPVRWRFVVNSDPAVVVADSDIIEGRYWSDGRSLSADEFANDVCEKDGGPLMDAFRAVTLFFLASGLAVTLGFVVRAAVQARRRLAAQRAAR